MASVSSANKPLLYGSTILALTALTLLLKVAITLLTELYLYSIPILGGLLKSIEAVELSNILIFAILGTGVGAATLFLSIRQARSMGLILLCLIVPFVLSSSYVTRHQFWIQSVAREGNISVAQARAVTDSFLSYEVGEGGILGFYSYTAVIPIPPTSRTEMQKITNSERRVRFELTRVSGVKPGIFAIVFRIVGWGIRIFYTLLSLLTAIIYFYRGLERAQLVRSNR